MGWLQELFAGKSEMEPDAALMRHANHLAILCGLKPQEAMKAARYERVFIGAGCRPRIRAAYEEIGEFYRLVKVEGRGKVAVERHPPAGEEPDCRVYGGWKVPPPLAPGMA